MAYYSSFPLSKEKKINHIQLRWLILALLLTITLHVFLFITASNYRVFSLLPPKDSKIQTKKFNVTSIPSPGDQKNPHSPQRETTTQKNITQATQNPFPHQFESAFTIKKPQITTPPPSPPQPAETLNIDQLINQPTLLRITDEGLLPIDTTTLPPQTQISLPRKSQSALPPANFELPTQIPATLAFEDLGSLEEADRALPGERSDELPSLNNIAGLFNPAKVQALETPEGIILRMSEEVLFEFNSAELNKDAIPVLKEIAQLLRRYAGAQVSIEGHTDTIGPADFNQKLSEQRAQTVSNWLTSQPAMVFRNPPQVIGYGESRPIVNPLGTREEQRKNRRVEIHIRAEKRPN